VTLPAVRLPNPQTEDVMALDFYNTAEDIKAVFDDFYSVTLLSGPTDVNLLHDLAEKQADADIYDEEHVGRFDQPGQRVRLVRAAGVEQLVQMFDRRFVSRFLHSAFFVIAESVQLQ
jgi:hypothetical protein